MKRASERKGTATTQDVRPALSGWRSGLPVYEANPAAGVRERKGTPAEPGVFEQIATQWTAVRALLAEGRADIQAVPVRLDVPSNPDAFELHWNKRAFNWLRTCVGVQQATGDPRGGIGALLAWAYDVPWFGFGVLVPRWDTEGPVTWESRLTLQPLVRAAVTRFETAADSLRPIAVRYQTLGVEQVFAYDDVVHLAWGGQPGEMFGAGELRALLGPWEVWRGSVTNVLSLQTSQRGRFVVKEPKHASPEDNEKLDEAGVAYIEHDLAYLRIPHDADAQFHAATSTASYGPELAWADAQADRLFASRNSSLVAAANGGRAIAEALGNEDQKKAILLWDDVIGDAVAGVLGWLALQTNYTGTIYRACVDRPQHSADDLDAAERAAALRDNAAAITALVAGNLLTWEPEDEQDLRKAFRMRPRSQGAATQTVDATPGAPEEAEPQAGYMQDELRLTLADERLPYQTTGADGRVIDHALPPVMFHYGGVDVWPERSVAWLADEDEEARLIAELDAELQGVIDAQRNDYAALGANPSPDAVQSVRQRYEQRYYAILLRQAGVWRENGVAQARFTKGAQEGTGIVATDDLRGANEATRAALIAAREGNVNHGMRKAAWELAGRVQGESLKRPGQKVRQALGGLAASAVGAMRNVSESARLIEALAPDETGRVVAGFVRTCMLDRRVCPHCRSMHGKTYIFPGDEREFVDDAKRHGPPDPHCAGTEDHCRCKEVPVYATT